MYIIVWYLDYSMLEPDFIRSSSRLELRCVCPYVRPYTFTKFFSDFHLIWCVGRPRPHMRTSVTSTRSKVKVKVTELPKLRKLHFSKSISSAVLVGSSKLMVGGDSMGPGPISEFPSRKVITRVQTSPTVHISRNPNGHISECVMSHGWARW